VARTKQACAAAGALSAVLEERVRPRPFQHCLLRGSIRRPGGWRVRGRGREREGWRERDGERGREGRERRKGEGDSTRDRGRVRGSKKKSN
jgi:hypothetical protein